MNNVNMWIPPLQQKGRPSRKRTEDVTKTTCGLKALRTGQRSVRAVMTVSNAPKIEPRARVMSIKKKMADQACVKGIFVTTSGYTMKARPGPSSTTSLTDTPGEEQFSKRLIALQTFTCLVGHVTQY